MRDKFRVYAQVRSTRQLSGDVKETLDYRSDERKKWAEIEKLLNEVECKLECMNLSDN